MSHLRLIVFMFLLLPMVASAHPLGNFSINQYWLLDLRGEEFKVFYMLDVAEIPSFTEMDRLDQDLNEKMSDEEISAYLELVAPELMEQMVFSADGESLELELKRRALQVYEGSGGMPVFNIFLDLRVPNWSWPQPDERCVLEFKSLAHENAKGYREAVILLDNRYEGDIGPYDEHDALKYMQLIMRDELDNPLLQSFYNIFRVELHDGNPESLGAIFERPDFDWTATARIDTEEKVYLAKAEYVVEENVTVAEDTSTPGAFSEREVATPSESSERAEGLLKRVTDTIRSKDLTTPMVVSAMLISLVLGMGHAFSPGHGKTVMAAYLIGERGTVFHAFALGVIVTVIHVWSVFLLGLVILYAGERVEEQVLVFWTSLASGLIIVGIGLLLFVRRYKSYILHLHASMAEGHMHDHGDGHVHSHDPGEEDHHHHHHHNGWLDDHDHHHGPGGHSHVIEGRDGNPPTYWDIFWLGVSGGIVPCPAALIVLLLAISLGRLPVGMLMLTSFSIGLAGVLVAIGIAVVKASGKVREKIGERSPLLLVLPVISSVLITGLGCLMVFMTLVQFDVIVLPN